MSKARSIVRALWWFGFRQTLKGAVIIGLLAGGMIALQAYGYIESYTDKATQTQFATSLKSAPSLGMLYGASDNLDHGVNGYVVYRVVSFMSFIVAIWGLMATTKLLRGNEEDGRWEVIRSGTTTSRSSTINVLVGFLYAFVLSLFISTILTILLGRAPSIALPIDTAILINLAIFAPALLFIGIGTLTAQLAITRRRALMYGLIPLLTLYLVRGIGNTDPNRGWLLNWTPFGWNELISPVISPQPWWLALFALLAVVFTIIGIVLSKRDLGSSVIRESLHVKSRFFLLGGPGRLALRQNLWQFIGWAASAFAMTAIIAMIITVAADATVSSPGLSKTVSALANNVGDIKVAFLGAGLVFVVMILMIMATTIIAGIRGDEAKQYLDNILVHPRRRTTWLITRLFVGVSVIFAIAIISGLILLVIGSAQDLSLETGKVLALSMSMIGTIVFLLGLGTLIYGALPRLAVIAMYVLITWSFIIDLVSSVIKLNDVMIQSSLFHYVSFNLTKWPDWTTFAWLIGLGIVMAALGTVLFAKRDIVIE